MDALITSPTANGTDFDHNLLQSIILSAGIVIDFSIF